jgi:hypothetical protein
MVAAVFAVPAHAAAPPNDNFGASIVISGEAGAFDATTAEATVEPDEPYHADEVGGASVWYTWTAPARGEYRFETCGSATDTLLAVYSGDTLATLSERASNDDACGAGSQVAIDLVPSGSTYRIAIDDAHGVGGPFVLRWRRIDHSPVNVSPPTISGSLIEGQTLSAEPGTWTARNPLTYSYTWWRCRASGPCVRVGAHERTYTLTLADVDSTIRVSVRAGTIDGAKEAESAKTPTVKPHAPVNTSPPTFSGTARVGAELTAVTAGGWEGRSIVFRYQWQRCTPDLASCADIFGATGERLRVTRGLLGAVIRLIVTATNPSGSVVSASLPSAVVQPALPKPCVVPRLRGKTVRAARKALVNAGCTLGKVRRGRSSLAKGRVSRQSARPGRRLRPRAPVAVVVSLGRNS